MTSNITLVTALYDINREALKDGFKRNFSHYLENFKKLLKLDHPIIIFCDPSLNSFIWKHRSKTNTNIINKTLEDIKQYVHYPYVQTIRNTKEWKNQAGWLADSPQSELEFYNTLVMAKQFMLNDASIYNTFDTKYFLWIDAGLSNTVNISDYFSDDNTLRQLKKRLNKMLYIAFPYDTNTEIHGFKKSAIDRYSDANVTRVVRGGLFGGTRESIAAINEVYYHTLLNTLQSGYMGTEESVFSILSYKYKHLINLEMIESDGLIYKFLERLKNNKNEAPVYDGKTAIYVLTYNSPKQFEYWIKSFTGPYKNFLNKYPKYVLNNSDDISVDIEYKRLFKQYNFTELKYNNIGITGGRIEIAKHFSKTKHEFMIFFEDDMLIRNDDNPAPNSGLGNGLNITIDDIRDIVTSEDLDYMKLSFDEFYGNNATNWAWHHASSQYKEKYFPQTSPWSTVDRLGTFRGIPYAVGDFFYCNWPILFTQEGNKKIFLNNPSAGKHEGALMYKSLELHRSKELISGCLLLSVIYHDRKYDYDRSKRKES